MSQLNTKVDSYISKSVDFAKPIMEHLRQVVHETCPDVQEAIKWGIPHFDYKGDMMLILAAYKNHCSLSFFKAELMTDKQIVESVKAGKKMGYMDKIKTMSDLPSKKILISLIKEAMTLNEKGIRKTRSGSEKPKVLEAPGYFEKALNANPKAKEIFETRSPSFRKDYLVWITGAKTDDTRQKRIEQSIKWIAEGKGRFWQYSK